MGVSTLRLVRPCPYDPVRLEGIAHDTRDLIDRIERFDDFDSAVADCVRLVGFTARRRAAKWRLLNPKEAAEDALGYADAEGAVAMVAVDQSVAAYRTAEAAVAAAEASVESFRANVRRLLDMTAF